MISILDSSKLVGLAGENALHIACKKSDATQVAKILSQSDLDANARDHNGWTALHEAVHGGSAECVRLLLSFEAAMSRKAKIVAVDLLATDKDEGLTPLHEAVDGDKVEIARLILQHARDNSFRAEIPPVDTLLAQMDAAQKAPGDLARSEEMKRLLDRFSDTESNASGSVTVCKVELPRFVPRLTPLATLLLPMMLSKCVAVRSLQFAKEDLKTTQTGAKRKFAGCVEVMGEDEQATAKRRLATSYTDLRSYNALRLLKPSSDEMKAAVRCFENKVLRS